MPIFECVTKCFAYGKLYNVGERAHFPKDEMPHFKLVDPVPAEPPVKQKRQRKPRNGNRNRNLSDGA